MGRLFEWVSIAVWSFVIFHHVRSLGVHPCLLIPGINNNSNFSRALRPGIASNSSMISPRNMGSFLALELEYTLIDSGISTWGGDFELGDCEKPGSPAPLKCTKGPRACVFPFSRERGYFWAVCLGKISQESLGNGVFLHKSPHKTMNSYQLLR